MKFAWIVLGVVLSAGLVRAEDEIKFTPEQIAASDAARKDVETLTQQIAVSPNDARLYLQRGIASRSVIHKGSSNVGSFKSATEDFNKAIELDSTLADAYYQRGTLAAEQYIPTLLPNDRKQDAETKTAIYADLIKYVELKPNDPKGYIARSRFSARLVEPLMMFSGSMSEADGKKFDQMIVNALVDAKKAVELQIDSAGEFKDITDISRSRFHDRLQNNQLPAAAEIGILAVTVAPTDTDLLRDEIDTLLRIKDVKRAVALSNYTVERAAKLPESAPEEARIAPLLIRGNLMILLKQNDRAAADFDAAEKAAPKSPLPFEARANMATWQNKPDEAIAQFTKAIEISDHPPVTSLLGRGDLYAQRKDWPAALADYKLATEKHPGDHRAWLRLSAAYEVTGDQKMALEALVAAKHQRAIDLTSRLRLAMLYVLEGMNDEGVAEYKSAAALLAPDPIRAHILRELQPAIDKHPVNAKLTEMRQFLNEEITAKDARDITTQPATAPHQPG